MNVFVLNFGILFQEFYFNRKGQAFRRTKSNFKMMRFLWVAMTMVLVMSYVGNLMTHHTIESFYFYLRRPEGQLSAINRRLLCQTEKRNSVLRLQ